MIGFAVVKRGHVLGQVDFKILVGVEKDNVVEFVDEVGLVNERTNLSSVQKVVNALLQTKLFELHTDSLLLLQKRSENVRIHVSTSGLRATLDTTRVKFV